MAKQDALRSLGEGGLPLHYVYLSKSESAQTQRYIGVTSDLKARIADHNAGKSPHIKIYALAARLVRSLLQPSPSRGFRSLSEIWIRARLRKQTLMVSLSGF
jgi:predicted GIY-YIG superfamily endonuclease